MRIIVAAFLSLIFISSDILAQTQGSEGNPATSPAKTQQTAGAKPAAKQEGGSAEELPKTESEVALEHFNKGQFQQNMKEYKEALANYNKAVELDSVFYDAYIARASVSFLTLDFETALMDYNKALSILERKSAQFQKTGDIKKVLDDMKGARMDYDKATYLKSRMGDVYYKRGSVKRFMDDKAGGCEDLQKAKELGAFKANPELKDFCK